MPTDARIESFVRAFEACTLPRAEWTHTGHLTVALWYLSRLPRVEATGLIREGIQRYNQSQGNPTGYHEIITLAWVAVVDAFLADRGRNRPLAELVPELVEACGRPDWLLRFYSHDRLMSPEARTRWVEPDLAPLP